jgi:hypothetical protein
MSEAPSQPPFWKRLTRHAVFPLLVYLVLTQLIRDNYPFSHYPMYSKPSAGDLHIQFLADGDGKPLPVSWHTGVTGSKVGKLLANRMKQHKTEKAAALDVLHFLRETNEGRRGRELPERIQLVETTLAFTDGKLVESSRVLAEDAAR